MHRINLNCVASKLKKPTVSDLYVKVIRNNCMDNAKKNGKKKKKRGRLKWVGGEWKMSVIIENEISPFCHRIVTLFYIFAYSNVFLLSTIRRKDGIFEGNAYYSFINC